MEGRGRVGGERRERVRGRRGKMQFTHLETGSPTHSHPHRIECTLHYQLLGDVSNHFELRQAQLRTAWSNINTQDWVTMSRTIITTCMSKHSTTYTHAYTAYVHIGKLRERKKLFWGKKKSSKPRVRKQQ